MPKVSVVVPVYGVEKFIERCARSLFEQTLEDMEFIFVDDCSKDKSIEILQNVIDEYPNRENQIRIIKHHKNLGLSHARETGVAVAKGDYIAHCDSDDWVKKNMYEEMYKFAKKKGVEIVKCAYFISDSIHSSVALVDYPNQICTNDLLLSNLFSWRGWNQIWVLLVKRSLYKDIIYTDYAMMEDFYVVAQLFKKVNKIAILNTPFYYYYKNPNSICGVSDSLSSANRGIQAYNNVKSFLDMLDDDIKVHYFKEIIRLKYEVQSRYIPSLKEKKYYKSFKNLFPEIKFQVFLSHYITGYEKIQYLFIIFGIYPIFKHFKK